MCSSTKSATTTKTNRRTTTTTTTQDSIETVTTSTVTTTSTTTTTTESVPLIPLKAKISESQNFQCGAYQDRLPKCVPGWTGYECDEKQDITLASMRHPVTMLNQSGISVGETYDMAMFSNGIRYRRETGGEFEDYEEKGDYELDIRSHTVSFFTSIKFKRTR